MSRITKVQGLFVDPIEIETAMLRLAPIDQVVVGTFENASGETGLFAVYTAKKTLGPDRVVKAVRGFLPENMIPSLLEQRPSLPLDSNGRIDRENILPPDISLSGKRREKPAARRRAGLAPIRKAAPRASWPLSFAERQMATEHGLNPESRAYNINYAFALTGNFDALFEHHIERALEKLIERHAILRSSYPMVDGEFVHRIGEEAKVSLARQSCAPSELLSRIAALNLPWDISRAPLFRFTLFRTGENERVLHLCIHHIIIDGVGIGILTTDFWRLYERECREDSEGAEPLPMLPPLPLDYPDYAVWQSENPNPDIEAEKRFFLDMFADGVPENEMPTRPTRPARLSCTDTDFVCELDADRVEAEAGRRGVTPYTLLMAAAGMTVAKYCGSEDVVLGTAMSGRVLPETGGMVGMFVNTLPVRLKPQGAQSLDEYIRQTAALLDEIKARQTCPFETLVPVLAPDRDASRSPLFDVVVNYPKEFPDPVFASDPGFSVRRLPIKGQAMEVDLKLEIRRQMREEDGSRKLRVVLSYSRDLYEDEIVCGMLEQFRVIVERILAGSDETLAEVSELPEAHRLQILEGFYRDRPDAPGAGENIVEAFRRQAARVPENPAVVCAGRVFSYSGLDGITDRLASFLIGKRGAKKAGEETPVVGVLVGRSEMMPIGALGVLKSGAAYLPLDPAYPQERLQFMLEDAQAEILIADDELLVKFPELAGRFPVLSTRELESLPAAGPLPDSFPAESLFILLYTSGTTGTPKGVMLTHGNLAGFCGWFREFYCLSEADRVSAYASFGFDACMMELHTALSSGACLHVIPEEMRLDLPRLNEYFNTHGVSLAFLTTQLGRQFAESMANTSLRVLIVGGETLVPLNPPQSYALYNCYGPTETTIFVTGFKLDRLYDRVPIGKPVGKTRIYVIDKHGRLAPVGTAGELCIAGPQVAAGYLRRPELSAEKFVPNPFSEAPGLARIYRTGDVARLLPGGEIDFVGRRDFQVKIRGFRVELPEIESRIRAFPAVTDAAVVAQDAPGGGKRAVAYIVADSPVEIGELNRFIEETLPPYMVPSVTMQIDRIPLNQNGKVDRKKLPAARINPDVRAAEIVPPATQTQKTLCAIVAEILGLDERDFGITTDLLYAGLNSLAAIRLAAQLSARTGKTLGAMEVMRERSVEKIAALLENAGQSEKRKYEKREIYPLTQNQLGLYFACAKSPDSVFYNVPFVLTLEGESDAMRLGAAMCAVIEAHPYLKTRLTMKDREVCQIRQDDDPVEIPVRECAETDWPEVRNSFVRPFNFFEGPLFRIELCRTPDRLRALCDFHHIIFDGGSLNILLRDLSRAWAGEKLERESFTSFDLALAEQESASGSGYAESKAFFDRLFLNREGEGSAAIPADFARETGSSEQGQHKPGKVFAAIEKNGPDFLSARLQELGVTPANLFLAATGFVASRFANARSIGMATITRGREGAELQENMGMLVKTVPVFVELASEETKEEWKEEAVETFLNRTQNRMFETLEHALYPYTRIVADHSFDPQIMFTFQGGVIEEYRLAAGTHSSGGHPAAGQPLRTESLQLDKVKFPIGIVVEDREDAYRINVEYDSSLFGEETMRSLAECIAHAAARFANPLNRGASLRGLSIATPAQMKTIAAWNAGIGPRETPRARNVPELFEAHAAQTPEKPALAAVDVELSYRELNERANRIAHALLERGLQREDRVAFMLPRDSRLICAILGIIKAGCAFIPVDPAYPQDRIAHILSDSGAKLLLTAGESGHANGVNIDALLKHENTANPGLDIAPEDLCYLIYTSGSTGKPKGVMLMHGGLINYTSPAGNPQIVALMEKKASFVSISTVSFDAFISDMFNILANGMRLVFADEEEARNPQKLARIFERTNANAICTTPSILMQHMEFPGMLEALARCGVIILGGEKFPPALRARLHRVSDAIVFNAYGPTEITICCNASALERDGAQRGITVGPPLGGFVEQVMDMDGNPLPANVVGELWIGGAGVARGYLNRPELTAERFVETGGVRYYKSGDLARWTRDGEILVLGRNDSQIKLRGLRIELGEIESTINAFPGVSRNVVLVRKLRGQEHLCAYYTARQEIPADSLRNFLARTLTPYMVPTAYLQLESMPVTPNGKIDTGALPEARLMSKGDYEAPRGDAETAWCEIFAKVLEIETPGALDSFFDLGGTSLLVTRVIIEAMDRGFEISYSEVFAQPTPRGLAALAEGRRAQEPQDAPASAGQAIGNYDYSKIHAMIQAAPAARLTVSADRSNLRPVGNICLTGATGFLGIHVLREYLRQERGAAWCVVRGGKVSAEKRLKNMLVYYFDDSFDALFGSRINIVEGDVCDPAMFGALEALPIDTLIHCAANVRHFSSGTDIEDINIGGAQNGIDFSRRKGCRFIHTSTASIAGLSVEGVPPEETLLDEFMFWFGQDLSNKYLNSKFIAERIVFEAALEGVDAKVMRLGNLMARSADGEFQANFNINSFLGQFRAYALIGAIPYEALSAQVEFSPIDFAAQAVLKLSSTPTECRVFHPYNNHRITLGDAIAALETEGILIHPCEAEEFEVAYSDALRNPHKAGHLSALIAYAGAEPNRRVRWIKVKNDYTTQVLLRLGLKWPLTSDAYLTRFIEAMKGLGFFDEILED